MKCTGDDCVFSKNIDMTKWPCSDCRNWWGECVDICFDINEPKGLIDNGTMIDAIKTIEQKILKLEADIVSATSIVDAETTTINEQSAYLDALIGSRYSKTVTINALETSIFKLKRAIVLIAEGDKQ